MARGTSRRTVRDRRLRLISPVGSRKPASDADMGVVPRRAESCPADRCGPNPQREAERAARSSAARHGHRRRCSRRTVPTGDGSHVNETSDDYLIPANAGRGPTSTWSLSHTRHGVRPLVSRHRRDRRVVGV